RLDRKGRRADRGRAGARRAARAMGARRDAGAAAGEVMATACPRCGAPAVERDKCAQCGVVASVYAAALEKMRRAPTPPPTPAAPRASAVPAAPRRAATPPPPPPAP